MISDQDEARALQIQRAFTGEVERVRSSPTLSAKGKARRIAELKLNTQAQQRQLREAAEERTNTVLRQAHGRLFGIQGTSAQEVIAARDAADRAATISTIEEARARIGQAERDGDRQLAAAIAARCHQMALSVTSPAKIDGWGGLAQQWAAHHGKGADLDLMVAEYSGRSNPATKFYEDGLFRLPPTPELGGRSPEQILASIPPEDG
jgi:hypothetical protein